MRVEPGSAPQCGRKKNKKKKRRSGGGTGRRETAAVQSLYAACAEVFGGGGAGVAPSPEDVARIRSVLDGMNPADVDLSPLSPHFGNVGADTEVKPVVYLHVYECDRFSIGIFCLPPSAVIPLHNHPGMTVFSKLLFGSMHIRSYDWADASRNSDDPTNNGPAVEPELRLAKVVADAVFTAPCDASILYPTSGGNIHSFTALTSCAVLDVLGPPYCDSEGRHCTYYSDRPYSQGSANGHRANRIPEDGEYVWLEEIERPIDFHVIGEEYTGPRIADDAGLGS